MPLPGPYASAAEMSAALARREVSSAELTEAAITRIEACEPKLNAVCVRTFEAAREAANAADARLRSGERGALLGVPMTIKESYNLVGTPTTWGVLDARDYRPAEDALAVQRVKAAGLVIVGKTNVPVGLGDWQSFNSIYGVTNNPYDLTRTPGGSSGGSSAAIAAGYAPLSLGSDIGGSLRTPAHFCGIFAHKPTHDLVPPRGHIPPRTPAIPNPVDLSVIGPMGRSAADCEALLDVVAGPDELHEGIGYRLALPPARHGRLDAFRVLVIDRHPLTETDATIVGAIGALADRLERAGAKVARSSELLPDLAVAGRLFGRMLTAIIAARLPEPSLEPARMAAETSSPDQRNVSALQPQGSSLSYREWFIGSAQRSGIRARWRALFKSFDAVICPIAPTPAFPHDHNPDQSARRLIVNGSTVPYGDTVHWSGVATLPGLPATALPIGRSPEGLPIGAQIIGPWLEDRTTLALAGLIEAEFGGFSPPPAFA